MLRGWAVLHKPGEKSQDRRGKNQGRESASKRACRARGGGAGLDVVMGKNLEKTTAAKEKRKKATPQKGTVGPTKQRREQKNRPGEENEWVPSGDRRRKD